MEERSIDVAGPENICLDRNGRMGFHPDFHENHGLPFSDEEKEYIAKFYEHDGARTVSFALGRTEKSVMAMYSQLKRKGKLDYYRSLGNWV